MSVYNVGDCFTAKDNCLATVATALKRGAVRVKIDNQQRRRAVGI